MLDRPEFSPEPRPVTWKGSFGDVYVSPAVARLAQGLGVLRSSVAREIAREQQEKRVSEFARVVRHATTMELFRTFEGNIIPGDDRL